MERTIEQRVRELIIAQLYHLETHERLMDSFEDEEGEQLDEAINKIARETMYAPDFLAACKEAYEFLDDRTDTYPEPCEDVPALSVMITLKFAIDKAKGE